MKKESMKNIEDVLKLFEETWMNQGGFIIYPALMQITFYNRKQFNSLPIEHIKRNISIGADLFSSSIDYIYQIREYFRDRIESIEDFICIDQEAPISNYIKEEIELYLSYDEKLSKLIEDE